MPRLDQEVYEIIYAVFNHHNQNYILRLFSFLPFQEAKQGVKKIILFILRVRVFSVPKTPKTRNNYFFLFIFQTGADNPPPPFTSMSVKSRFLFLIPLQRLQMYYNGSLACVSMLSIKLIIYVSLVRKGASDLNVGRVL